MLPEKDWKNIMDGNNSVFTQGLTCHAVQCIQRAQTRCKAFLEWWRAPPWMAHRSQLHWSSASSSWQSEIRNTVRKYKVPKLTNTLEKKRKKATFGSNVAKNLTNGWNSSAASSYSIKSGWSKTRENKFITAVSFARDAFEARSLGHSLQPTRRFLALEKADQLDDLVHVVETLQLALVVNDLHGVFNHLTRQEANTWWIFYRF